jgi:hypothetical protein
MKNRLRVLLVALLATLGLSLVAVTAAAPAAAIAPQSVSVVAPAIVPAGSDNGTNNWYSSDSCTASGGRLDITNYDIIVSGSVWQQYHIDADRAGGTGTVPKVYTKPIGSGYSWQNTTQWNDFYMSQSNQWQFNDFRVNFANGSVCYIWAL